MPTPQQPYDSQGWMTPLAELSELQNQIGFFQQYLQKSKSRQNAAQENKNDGESPEDSAIFSSLSSMIDQIIEFLSKLLEQISLNIKNLESSLSEYETKTQEQAGVNKSRAPQQFYAPSPQQYYAPAPQQFNYLPPPQIQTQGNYYPAANYSPPSYAVRETTVQPVRPPSYNAPREYTSREYDPRASKVVSETPTQSPTTSRPTASQNQQSVSQPAAPAKSPSSGAPVVSNAAPPTKNVSAPAPFQNSTYPESSREAASYRSSNNQIVNSEAYKAREKQGKNANGRWVDSTNPTVCGKPDLKSDIDRRLAHAHNMDMSYRPYGTNGGRHYPDFNASEDEKKEAITQYYQLTKNNTALQAQNWERQRVNDWYSNATPAERDALISLEGNEAYNRTCRKILNYDKKRGEPGYLEMSYGQSGIYDSNSRRYNMQLVVDRTEALKKENAEFDRRIEQELAPYKVAKPEAKEEQRQEQEATNQGIPQAAATEATQAQTAPPPSTTQAQDPQPAPTQAATSAPSTSAQTQAQASAQKEPAQPAVAASPTASTSASPQSQPTVAPPMREVSDTTTMNASRSAVAAAVQTPAPPPAPAPSSPAPTTATEKETVKLASG